MRRKIYNPINYNVGVETASKTFVLEKPIIKRFSIPIVFIKLLGFLLSLLVVILVTFPAAQHLTTEIIGDGGDNFQYFTWQQVATQNIEQGKWFFSSSTTLRYPDGFPFARGADAYLFTMYGALLNIALQNPILAYNLSVFSLLFFNIYCSFLLFRYLSKSQIIGFIGAIIYGLSFHTLAKNGSHPNLALTAGFPLFVYALLKLKEEYGSKKKYFFLLGISVALIAAASFQQLLIFVGSLPFVLLITLYFAPKESKEYILIIRKHIISAIAAAVFSLAILLVFCYPYLQALITGDFAQKSTQFSDLFYWAPSILDYIRPNSYYLLWYQHLFTPSLKTGIDFSVFLGFIEPILFILFLFLYKSKKIRLLVGALFAIFFIFSLGVKNPDTNALLPYGLLSNLFPYWGIPEVGRWYIVFYLFFTIGIVLFLKQIKHFSKFLGILLIVLLLAERISTTFYLSPMDFTKSNYISVVKNTSGNAVLDLPIDITASPVGNRYNILPFYYGKDGVNGYTQYSLDDKNHLKFLFSSGLYQFMCQDIGTQRFFADATNNTEVNPTTLIKTLKANGINTIVLHKAKDSHIYFGECENALHETTRLLPRFYTISGNNQIQMLEMRRFYNGKINYTLYFPASGNLTLDHFQYAYPHATTDIPQIQLNGTPIDESSWTTYQDFEYGRWVSDTVTRNQGKDITINVPPGSTMTITSNTVIPKEGFLNVWYQFRSDANSPTVSYQAKGIKKIYEDDQAEVWILL